MAVLHYVSDDAPGISRRRRGKGFSYIQPNGAAVTSEATLARIRRLAIPPAYRDVWICEDERGHLQATGFDARGRKQYRYHPDWEEERSMQKFEQLVAFGNALPRIRNRMRRDFRQPLPSEAALLAAMVWLIDKTRIRVGNRSYARQNRTFGASSLLKQHVDLGERGLVRLKFTGKGGNAETHEVHDEGLFGALDEITDLPGRDLFSWRTEQGELRRIDASKLNAYLSQVAGFETSAKMFRTWGGSVAALDAAYRNVREGRRVKAKNMCDAASQILHNTSAVCRTSYVHPAILVLADQDKASERALVKAGAAKPKSGLLKVEVRLLAFLQAL